MSPPSSAAGAQAQLRALLRTIADKHYHQQKYTIDIQSINSGGANYTSALFNIKITSDDNKNSKISDANTLHLFAKVAIVGEKMRKLMNATKIYTIEGFFYSELIKTYENIQEKHGVTGEDRFSVPKYYGCNPTVGEETVVLENLTARGYEGHDRFKSLDWEQASSAVEELAKFHALSFAYQKEKPEEFKRVMEYLWFYRPNSDESGRNGYFKKMLSQALKLIDEEHRSRVVRFVEEGGAEMYERYNRPFGNPVLIHGDYRPSNLLFKRQGEKIHTIAVDFQTVHTGCVITDLVYFIFMGTDSAFRNEHFHTLTELYYEQLCVCLKRLGVDSSDVYTRSEFDRELKEVLPYAIFLSIWILPVVLVEADNAPRVDGDSDINSFIIDPNDLYADRLRGIVDDCVKLGAI